ncbi:hypothetical protein [Niastella sp. OAS944]|uniref:hypothetical protein n=1 Tax=Niastella sp. OAS944 TaxID=2664089 RepID=UPI00348FECDE|nr:hypothetical protein [Chitinophagaceae bacterium OAS944]
MKIRILLMSCYCIFNFRSVAQTVSVEKELYIVDTIEIKDPILIRFVENKYVQSVLVSKERLDSVRKDDTSYLNFLCAGSGYLLFQAAEFSCFFNNLLYYYPALKDSPFYTKLQTQLYKADQDTVYVPIDRSTYWNNPKKHNGWAYREIYPRKFLLCLAKGRALRRCQGRDEIKIYNMDNVYFKILLPITKNFH